MDIFKYIKTRAISYGEHGHAVKFNNMPKFSLRFPGALQENYTLVTAGTKAGKTNFVDYNYLFNIFLDSLNSNRIPIFLYFTLELSTIVKQLQFLAMIVYYKHNVRLSKALLKSNSNKLSSKIYSTYIKNSKDLFDKLLSSITFVEDCFTVEEIYKRVNLFASSIGKEVKGEYVLNNKNYFPVIILDNFNLLATDKKHFNLKTSIDALSHYFVKARNKFKFLIIAIQQQATDQESKETIGFNEGRPSIATLGDSRITARDADITIGIYSPFLYDVPSFKGYDMTKFKDHFRYIEILRDRDGNIGWWTPLYYDGAPNYWSELPNPNQKETETFIKLIKNLKHV